KENIIGHSPGEFSPPTQPDGAGSAEQARAHIRAALEGDPQRFYWKHVRMDGTPFDAEVALNPIELEDGSLVQAIVRDITQQKRAEEALRVAEENYKNIFRNAVMGIYKSTPEGYHISVNPALARIYGYDSPEELIHGMRDIASQLYVDPDRRAELARRLQEEGKVVNFTSQVYRKDGATIWISESARTVRDDDGEIAYFVGTVEDVTDRKRAEEALRESEARYEAFFDRTMLAVYVHDFSGNFIDANQAARGLLGYSEDEIPSLTFAQLLDDEGQVERAMETIEEIWETGMQEEPTEYRLRTKNGDVVWIETEGALIYREGKPYAVQGIARDITARKRAQMALEHSEMRFRNLVENANDAIYIIHPERGFQYVNPAFENITGYSAETVYGEAFSFWNVIHPDDRELVKNRAMARESGEDIPSRYEFRLLAADDDVKVVEVATVDIGTGDEPLVMGILRDITDRIEMEKALKESEEKFRLLAESSTSAIFIHQGETFQYVNPAMEEMSGYGREELENMTFWDVVHPDHRDLVRERGKQRISGDTTIPKRYEIKVVTRDGTEKWADLTATTIVYRGEPAVLGTAYDITERKRAYEEMERALEKERVFKLKTAHHFFNPISIAKGYIDLVSDNLSEEDRKKIQAARGAIQRVEAVVKNVTQRGEICE
ncbi:MAG: PAS domain S-box protein, partial [Thermoplasmatota archaeon]